MEKKMAIRKACSERRYLRVRNLYGLGWGVPEGQVEGDTREIAGFKHTEENTSNDETSEIFNNTHQSHDLHVIIDVKGDLQFPNQA